MCDISLIIFGKGGVENLVKEKFPPVGAASTDLAWSDINTI